MTGQHVVIGALLAIPVLTAGFALAIWPVINVVATGETPEYPDLVPRVYRAKPDRVFDASLHAVHRMPRWILAGYDAAAGQIRAEARTRVFGFVDDVVIHVQARGPGTHVHVRSASRVGRADFGQNARNVRSFFEELDRQMRDVDHQ